MLPMTPVAVSELVMTGTAEVEAVTVIEPFLTVPAAIAIPFGSVKASPVTGIRRVCAGVAELIVICAVSKVPLLIGVWLKPKMTNVQVVPVMSVLTFLPACVTIVPGVTVPVLK